MIAPGGPKNCLRAAIVMLAPALSSGQAVAEKQTSVVKRGAPAIRPDARHRIDIVDKE